MSYQCGVDATMARLAGIEPVGEPRITCDGCGIRTGVTRSSGRPYAWFLDGKPKPGWSKRLIDDRRFDYCPRCKETEGGK